MTAPLLPLEGVPAEAWATIARPDGSQWAIDERDATGEVIGTGYRASNGSKTFKPGGKRGMILPWPLPSYAGTSVDNPVFVCEGASDTATLLGLGFDAVGVPMAGHSGGMLAELLDGRHAVIVADADDAGVRGAGTIADALTTRCASVRIIAPPGGAKDARAAVMEGAGATDFRALADAAEPVAPAAPAPAAAVGAPMLVWLCDVKPESVVWLWPGRIALGKLTLIAGDPGLGKSFLTLDVAARVSTGASWPDRPGERNEPGGVVLLSAEDDLADTIRPRLDAAGADVSRIVALQAVHAGAVGERAFDLSRDVPALEAAIRSMPDCRLAVIDPVTAYLGGVDSHKNAEVRGLLAPLSDLAARFGIAVVAVTHLNKSSANAAIHRTMGSVGFVAAARAAWVVTKDKDDPLRRLLLPIKNNVAPDAGGLAYRIETKFEDPRPVVTWEPDPVSVSADDALSSERGDAGGRTERDDAADWLLVQLRDGPRPARDLVRDAREAGFSVATVRRAKALIGAQSRKSAFGGHWEWALPAEGAQAPRRRTEEAHAPARERLGTDPSESNEVPPKMLTRERVSSSAEGERLGGTPLSGGEAGGCRRGDGAIP